MADNAETGLAAEGEAIPSPAADLEVTEVPPLPPSVLYDSFDDLFNFLQAWARSNGVGFVKKAASNRREINGTKIPTYWLLLCDRGPARPSESRGHRQTSTQKVDCPVQISASATQKNN